MSWAPEVKVIGNDGWSRNQLRFATRDEAFASARDLAQRWTLVVDFQVGEAIEPVNYRWCPRSGPIEVKAS